MKRAGRLIGLIGLLLMTSTLAGAWRAAPLDDDPPPWCVSVWYPSSDSGGLDSLRSHTDVIQLVNAFWYSPNADGTLRRTDRSTADDTLVSELHGEGVRVFASIYSIEWRMLIDPAVRAFHEDQITALLTQADYDGVDIDYESFPVITRDNFSTFIEELAPKIRALDKTLSVTVHAKTDDAGTWYGAAAQDWTRLAPAADVFTIMTYDFTSTSQPPGPISPPAWVHNVLAYAATVTGLGKVRMGLPFYGYTWTRDNPPAKPATWAAAQRLIQSFQPEIQRDPANMEARIEVKARGLPKQTIYFADSVGIQYKVQLVLHDFPDLGGVAIWGIGGEDPANWDVLRAARHPNCRT